MNEARAATASLQLKIGGMSCSFCANSITRALGRERGVEEVHVSLAHEEALVRYRPAETDRAALEGVLRSLGYIVRDPRKLDAFAESLALRRRERNDLASAAFFAVSGVLAMGAMWLRLFPMEDWYAWAAWAVASYVFFFNGRRIIRMAWGAARRGITNQHVLLSVGALGGYAGGLLGTPLPLLDWYGFVGFPPVDFFGVVVFLTTYHLLSGYVSLVVRSKASESVRRLLSLQPERARVVREGRETEVPIEALAAGDRVRVRPGERVPVDGVVEQGASAVDQSLVTGEPIPEDKGPGDEVIGGSINQAGTLLVRVTRVGEETFLRQVARHVEEAKAMKPGIVVLVDRVLLWYVPAVLGVAAAAVLFWGFAPLAWGAGMLWVTAIYAGVTVLVMGYPCALGMATPLALIRGGGIAAEHGILMRSGEAFQAIKDLTHVVFDKTGTLTEGKPRLVAVEPLGGFERAELLRLAAGAESASEHPLARAIAEGAVREEIEAPAAERFQAAAGRGVEARVQGREVLVGTERYLAERGVAAEPATSLLEAHEAQAHTCVLVALERSVAGVLAIADAVKADAAEAVRALKRRGIVPVLVTGDNRRTAEAVARAAGIDEIHAQILPQDKASLVRELQRKGARVAMVGDGINDAPALTQAHVGIAIGAGTDIAIESADVVLVGKRLAAVPQAIEIGAMSYRKTVQNLWLAFFFNGVGVPVATTTLLHPTWAMAAMAASVSAVLANSFGGRLLGARPAVAEAAEGAPAAGETDRSELVISVPGMHCAGCVDTIRAGLSFEAGVVSADGDARAKTIRVCYLASATSRERLEAAVERLGFRVTRQNPG
jgi:heavy metal translocating P-type ATPase